MFIFIPDVQRYDKIETMLQGPFGAINPSQIQQLMQQVGDKNVMFFLAKCAFVRIQKMKTFSEQNATNLASGDGGRKGLEQLIPQLQVFVCLLVVLVLRYTISFLNIFFFSKRH